MVEKIRVELINKIPRLKKRISLGDSASLLFQQGEWVGDGILKYYQSMIIQSMVPNDEIELRNVRCVFKSLLI